MTRLALTVVLLGLSSVALAQSEEPPAQRFIYRQVTEVTFDERAIDALPERPDGYLIWSPPPRTHTSFINLRTDFDEELEASVNQVK